MEKKAENLLIKNMNKMAGKSEGKYNDHKK
jgi:hypothetical protein